MRLGTALRDEQKQCESPQFGGCQNGSFLYELHYSVTFFPEEYTFYLALQQSHRNLFFLKISKDVLVSRKWHQFLFLA